MWEIIKTGIIFMIYTLVAGSLLAFVYIKTSPVIEANRAAAMGDNVMLEVLPGMVGGFEKQVEDSDFTYWIGYSDAGRRKPGGYIFIAYGKGYAPQAIETMVGVDTDGTITGSKILFQRETPGLGDKLEEIKSGESDPWFPRQFVEKSAKFPIAVTKDGGDINAISGATVSSRAVTESINSGLVKLMEITSGGTFTQKADPNAPVIQEEPVEEEITVIDELIAGILPDMEGGYEIKGEESGFPYWVGYLDTGKSTIGGYAFVVVGEGFQSDIKTLVGVDTDITIVGIKIIFQDETPEIGDIIIEIRESESEPWFPRQFVGKSLSDTIALTGDGGVIDSISEATISSKAVTESVNNGLERLTNILESSPE
ncbi:FMN-binding protein [Candidatus Latescibacterota bacterium]